MKVIFRAPFYFLLYFTFEKLFSNVKFLSQRKKNQKKKKKRETESIEFEEIILKFIFLNTMLNLTLMELSTSIYTQSKEGRKDSGESCNRFTRALTNSHTCTVL